MQVPQVDHTFHAVTHQGGALKIYLFFKEDVNWIARLRLTEGLPEFKHLDNPQFMLIKAPAVTWKDAYYH